MNRESLFSGFLIGLGATGYLALGGIPGAVIFAFGLVCVVLFGVPLYTGKAGVTNDIPALVRIWLFNIIGCALLGRQIHSLKASGFPGPPRRGPLPRRDRRAPDHDRRRGDGG